MADEKTEEIGLHNLKPNPGSRHRKKRIGRGEGSGFGKTSGRGQNGAGSRSGSKRKVNLEGGQMPIHMRLRKLRGPHMKKSMPFEQFGRTQTQPVNLRDLEQRFDDGAEVNCGGSNVLGSLNLSAGGSLQRFAVFALGTMRYSTASIILQRMQGVVPSLAKLRQEGEVGQQKITQYTRYLTVGLAFAQSIGYVFLFRQFAGNANTSIVKNFTFGGVFVIVLALTTGTVLVMWFGELITQRGLGNGISLMIFASITARLPHGIQAWWTNPDAIFKVMMPFLALVVIAAIVFIQEGQRRIPVQYAKRVVGRKMAGGGATYLPLRVNMGGVIPVIFAADLMAVP